MQPPLPHANAYWVEPGRLMAGEYPGHPRKEVARQRLAAYLDCGVDTFIDLTTRADPLTSYAALLQEEAARRGIECQHRSFPIVDLGVPASPRAMADILDAIDLALASGRRVYVHCWGGVGRTGTVVGCYLVRHGLPGAAALDRLAELWSSVAKVSRRPTSPETRSQVRFVLGWQEPG